MSTTETRLIVLVDGANVAGHVGLAGASTGPMSKEEAADYYWRLFIKRLE